MEDRYYDSNNHLLRNGGFYHHRSEKSLNEFCPAKVIRIDNEFFIEYENEPLRRIYPNNNPARLEAMDLTEIKKGMLSWMMGNTSYSSFLQSDKEKSFV